MTYLDFVPGDMWITIDGSILLLVHWSRDEHVIHVTFFAMYYGKPWHLDLAKPQPFFSIDYNIDVMSGWDDNTIAGLIIRDGVEIWRKHSR